MPGVERHDHTICRQVGQETFVGGRPDDDLGSAGVEPMEGLLLGPYPPADPDRGARAEVRHDLTVVSFAAGSVDVDHRHLAGD
jgi:hypothetical protein